jgi:hypothetical protein
MTGQDCCDARGRNPVDSVAELAYDEAARRVSQQRASLDELRVRTGTLLSAAIIGTTFLAGFAIKGTGHGIPHHLWGPIILFGLVILFCILVLVPGGGWAFALDSKGLLERIDEANPPAMSKIYKEAVVELSGAAENNDRLLNLRFYGFVIAATVLLGEIVWWLVEIT